MKNVNPVEKHQNYMAPCDAAVSQDSRLLQRLWLYVDSTACTTRSHLMVVGSTAQGCDLDRDPDLDLETCRDRFCAILVVVLFSKILR